MNRKLLTGNGAAAWGARLAQVDYVPAFPITPQTEIIETLAHWIDTGELDGRLVTLESEHSMLTAAGAAAATGVRVFTATSSQGLLYAMEMLYTVAGWRAPFVLVNVSRGLAAPSPWNPIITILWRPGTAAFCRSTAPVVRKCWITCCWPTGWPRMRGYGCR